MAATDAPKESRKCPRNRMVHSLIHHRSLVLADSRWLIVGPGERPNLLLGNPKRCGSKHVLYSGPTGGSRVTRYPLACSVPRSTSVVCWGQNPNTRPSSDMCLPKHANQPRIVLGSGCQHRDTGQLSHPLVIQEL